MSEAFEKDSIESIAGTKWGEYSGDVNTISEVERIWGVDAHDMVRDALRANFIEGFRQGVLLRLTGDTDAHG